MVKYGAITRLTYGLLNVTGAAVNKWNPNNSANERIRLHQQIEIYPDGDDATQPFAKEGDSGSLVFTVPENGDDEEDICAIGMIVGGTTYGSVIVTPIWAILERFDLPLKLISFNDQRIRNLNRGLRDVKRELSNLAGKIDLLLNQFAVPQNS